MGSAAPGVPRRGCGAPGGAAAGPADAAEAKVSDDHACGRAHTYRVSISFQEIQCGGFIE